MIKAFLQRLLNSLPEPDTKSQPTPAEQPEKPAQLSAKDQATLAGQPWISVLSFELDEENVHNGAFELDWNDLWVAKLVRAGYKIKDTDTDQDIVDRWFTTICRNIALEMYEQEVADPLKRELAYKEQRVAGSKNLGNGRREVS